MDFKKILLGLLSTAYKMDSEKIEEIFAMADEAALIAALLDADKNRIAGLTPKQGQTFQDGYAKAKKDVLSDFEKQLKEKYGVVADVTGIDLVDTIVSEKSTGSATLTDNDVMRHQKYQELETRLTSTLTQKDKEWKDKYEARERELSKSQVIGQVKGLVLTKLESLNPVLSATPVVAQTQKDNFAKLFENYDYQINPDGSVIIMRGEEVLKDAHGNTLKLDDLVKEKAPTHFDFKKNAGGQSPQNNNDDNNDPDPTAYPAGIKKPTTEDELFTIITDNKISIEDRNKVQAAWDSEH